ncbi:MAG: GH1 family beta-glucosidase [Ferruginibacter sp.]|nr:GH1 family beta-glucosidase [Ferruginibacter sp.]
MSINAGSFGDDFNWGVSTAAYQIEGAWDMDGKGKSIWDVFSNTPGKIAHNQHGNQACDFYHRYAHDITLMSQLNIPNYRFSLSWSRIIPNGSGQVNSEGIDFYNRVIDFCLEQNIEPWITLYHWDLPHALELKGGWTNREIIYWFEEYVKVCIRHFGDRVKRWMILNEPMVFTGAGYFLGIHAPGKKGLSSFLAAAHHAAMCQAAGGRIVRSLLPGAIIGTTFSCSQVMPCNHSWRNLAAATRVDALLNRMFVEPLAGLGYPVKDLRMLQRLEPFIRDGDEAKLAFDMDFIGVQNYTREVVAASLIRPLIWAKIIHPEKRQVPTTEMHWEVYPRCIYEVLKKFDAYKFPSLVVTENGAAFPDVVYNGRVSDPQRQDYLQQHISQVLRARREGIPVNGYFVWSFTDNFEWAEGYRPRFGLVHVDFKTQKRIIKDSGFWYGQFIKSSCALTIK